MSRIRQAAFITLILVAALVLATIMTGCKMQKQVQASSVRIDSTIVTHRDTSYYSRDSSGKTYRIETIREFHHYHDTGSNHYYPVLDREIIHEAGQIVYVNVDSGRVVNLDSLAYYREALARSKQVETGFKIPWWLWVAALLLFTGTGSFITNFLNKRKRSYEQFINKNGKL